MSSSRIIVLATIIEQNTRKVDDYLREEGLPSPSFEATNPPDLPLPPPITEAKQAVLEAMDELEALMLGPMPKIFNDLIIKVIMSISHVIGSASANDRALAHKLSIASCNSTLETDGCFPRQQAVHGV
jgi:hypothetical protein